MPEKSSTLNERWRALGSPWRPGMRDSDGSFILNVDASGLYTSEQEWDGENCFWRHPFTECAPDWTDPATLGALLGLVRERYGDPHLVVLPVFEGRRLSCWACVYSKAPPGFPANGDTEAEALA